MTIEKKHTQEIWVMKGIYVMLIVLLLGLVAVIFMWTYPFKVMKFPPGPVKIMKGIEIHPGDAVPINWKYTKFTDKPAHILVSLSNDKQIVLEDMWGVRGPGTYDYIGYSIRLPEDIAPGRYKIKVLLQYRLNPVRDVSYKLETEYFDVVPWKEKIKRRR